MSAPRTARERVHQEMSSEILTVARAQLAQNGAAALSLRSIARQLEMAPSALYRYYPGRDALLSALILSAYGSLADTAERASQVAYAAGSREAELWGAVPRAMRQWALGHPHEWGLIFGTPVPGYQAPEDTVAPYGRIAVALVRPVVEARAAGHLAALMPIGDATLRLAVAPVTDALFPDMPTATVVATLQAWTTLVGAISLELFGHWRNTVHDPERFFEQTLGALASSVGLR